MYNNRTKPQPTPSGVAGHTLLQEQLDLLDRKLRLLSECNRVLIHACNEEQMLNDICHVVSEVWGHDYVWVGLPRKVANFKRVYPAGHVESKADFVNIITDVSWDNSALAKGLTGSVLRTGKARIEHNICESPHHSPWRTYLLSCAIASGLSIPLTADGEILGALTIYSTQRSCFGPDDLEFLASIGNNVAHAMISLRKDQQRRLAESQLYILQRAVESSNNGIMISDVMRPDNPIVYANQTFERITGYSVNEVIGRNGRFLIKDNWKQKELGELRSALRERRKCEVVLQCYRKDGTMFWNNLSVAPVSDASGTVTHFVSIINDVTDRVIQNERLEHQARHDSLTGLPNRVLLEDHLARKIALAMRYERKFAVMFIDLDNFKLINDGLGHAVGDEVLKVVASRLDQCARHSDIVARMGGDEFVVILSEIKTENDVADIAQRILQQLSVPVSVAEYELHITCSIGVSYFPADGKDTQSLMKNADGAMYHAKRSGRNNFQYHKAGMETKAVRRISLAEKMHQALENDELSLAYQSKIDVNTGRITGAETLIRWCDPELGDISPSDFIPIAEETGLILSIGQWVFNTACAQARTRAQAGLPTIPIAVNLSPRQFADKNLSRLITESLISHNIDPSYIQLELTESAMLQNPRSAAALLNELREEGLLVYLDDFGTGYSSLNHLRLFQFDGLKIDQSFIKNVNSDSSSAAIVSGLIALAHKMGLKVVAEGVEDRRQLEFLQINHCDEVQGYLFDRPRSAEAFQQYIESTNPHPAISMVSCT